jgi:ATP-binding cassette subfamily A (ABC1) protein 3
MAGRSVILTTHSMEEVGTTLHTCSALMHNRCLLKVEALSHNIGIMVDGRLQCLGNKQHLKEKYGASCF